MVSALARVVCQRGHIPLPRVGGVVVHATGTPDIAKALDVYKTDARWPHYVIDEAGFVYSTCDEGFWGAHVAWHDAATGQAEFASYVAAELRRDASWTRVWIDTLGDGKLKAAPDGLYQDWLAAWGAARGLAYSSPLGILRQVGGREATAPNGVYLGIELTSPPPGATAFSDAQIASLAALLRDVFARHSLALPIPDSLPQAFLLGHADLSPMRRTTAAGKPFDPSAAMLDWRRLERALLGGAAMLA